MNGPLSGDASGSRRDLYTIAPSSSGAVSNAVAFTQPALTVTATAGTVLAYDTTKQDSLSKESTLEFQTRPGPAGLPPLSTKPPAQSTSASLVASPVPAEPVWNFGYAQNAGAIPAITARFANINQEVEVSAKDKKQFAAKAAEPRGEGGRAQPLSATFNVEQNGDSIRIVDFDGSIYTGRLLQRANLGDAEEQKAERFVGAVNQVDQLGQVAADDAQAAFRASGTNRTLNKLVVVNGAMFGRDTAPIGGLEGKARGYRGLQEGTETYFKRAPEAAKPAPTSKVNAPTNLPLPQILRASSIKGTVRLDVTNVLKIEAKRVSQ